MAEDISLDYSAIYGREGHDSERYGDKNITIPEALAKNLTQVAMPCVLCKSPIFCEIVGIQLAEIVQGRCPKKTCPNHTGLPLQHKISHLWPLNLSTAFLTLSNDSGYRGIQAIAWSHNLKGMCKSAYQTHCKFIYKHMNLFYEANQNKAIESVKAYYRRTGEGIEDENGIMEICITLDGAYGRYPIKWSCIVLTL